MPLLYCIYRQPLLLIHQPFDRCADPRPVEPHHLDGDAAQLGDGTWRNHHRGYDRIGCRNARCAHRYPRRNAFVLCFKLR